MYISSKSESNRKKDIKNIFKNKFNIELDEVSETTKKTSDFEYKRGDKRFFVMEMKFLEHIVASNETGYSKKDKFWVKKDNSASKIASVYKTAYGQLKDYNEPKICLFVNESIYDFQDLISAITGKVQFENSELNVYRSVSEGEIRVIKRITDLFIWIDPPTNLDNIENNNFDINFYPNSIIGSYLKRKFFII